MTSYLCDRYGGWALVTGASSGIGEQYAISLSRRGFPLILTARRQERLLALAKRLKEEDGTECLVVPLDLADPTAAAALEEAVGDREVSVLVNNAGFGYSGRFHDLDGDRYARMVAVNCAAPVALTHRFLPPMIARGRGAVIIVASVAAYQPTPFFAVYGATKAFDLMLAEALWSELRGTGIDVQALSPGETKTEFSSQAHFARGSRGMSSLAVVEGSLNHLGRGPSYVPGAKNKLAAFLHRLLPRSWTAHVTGAVLAKEVLRSTPGKMREKTRAERV